MYELSGVTCENKTIRYSLDTGYTVAPPNIDQYETIVRLKINKNTIIFIQSTTLYFK